MSAPAILAIIGFACTLLAFGAILARPPSIGNPALALSLCAGFAAFSALAIGRDGLLTFWTNHTANLVGVQVWWDLLLSVTLAFFLLASRARGVGMNVPLWALLVVLTASIGLLAMAARLFWLERRD